MSNPNIISIRVEPSGSNPNTDCINMAPTFKNRPILRTPPNTSNNAPIILTFFPNLN